MIRRANEASTGVWLLSLRGGEFMNMCDLGDMLEGTPLNPSHSMNAPLMWLVLISLACLWVLVAGFPREVQRLRWAWSRPRNLALRNASETPRTMGVVLNAGLSMLGLEVGLMLLEQEGLVSLSWWTGPAWVLTGMGLRALGGRFAFGAGDLSSTLVELSRHNSTWVGLALAGWTGVVLFSPHLQSLNWESYGMVMMFSCAMLHGAMRATQLVRASNSQRLVGILYLCILEWGWTLLWIGWSVGLFVRGH